MKATYYKTCAADFVIVHNQNTFNIKPFGFKSWFQLPSPSDVDRRKKIWFPTNQNGMQLSKALIFLAEKFIDIQ